MSTMQGYDYEIDREQARRAEIELERRRMELVRLRAERAAAVHRRTVALAAEAERRGRSELGYAERALEAAEQQSTDLTRRSEAARHALGSLQSQLEASRAQLTQARRELQTQVDRCAALEGAAQQEASRLAHSLGQAREALHAADQIGEAANSGIDALANQAAEGEQLAAREAELERSIQQLESEVRFVTQQAQLMPAAMTTLMAMEQNGYRLGETLSRQGLIGYFEKEGERHQIAVRCAAVSRPGEDLAQWQVLAETFGLLDERCLHEIADFETSVEEQELGSLRRNQLRVYPKDDRSRRGLLPLPGKRRRTVGTRRSEPRRIREG